jgi:RHS repeat-associated protein
MLVPNRNYSSPSYRYGFQGQEKDDEIKGNGNSLNYKYRMHDPRVGRFFAVDPLTAKYPHYTPYSFSGNKVIQFIELEGLEEKENNALSARFLAWEAWFSGGFWGAPSKASKELKQIRETTTNEAVREIAFKSELKQAKALQTTTENLKTTAIILGSSVGVIIAVPLVIYAAPTIAVVIPSGTAASLETSLGFAGADVFKQIIQNGGDPTKVDLIDAAIEGAFKGKSGIAKEALKSFLDYSVENKGKINNLSDTGYETVLRVGTNKLFSKLGITSSGDIINDAGIKILKSQTRKGLDKTIKLIFSHKTIKKSKGMKILKGIPTETNIKEKDNIPH